ncbi:MAG: ribose-phosphate pyrophosphokinase [Candidatus Omnitrophica bacterium]|nr:ribose-phosphate pyrophosphokinase [Candidatus Omnitrophota bacterium]
MKDKLKIFSGNTNISLAKDICKYLDVELSHAMVSEFPDGEIKVKIEENVREKDVYIIQPTSTPVNNSLMELLIMIDALKRSSAKRITAVIPYFGYARQDRKDQPRVPVTAKLTANLITNAGADRVLTVDLHAGQIQGFFDIPLDNLYAVNLFVDYFSKKKLSNMVVVSPDVGGIKAARAYAKKMNADLAIVDKRRKNDSESEAMNILGDIKNKNVIIVDDMASTAGSLVEAAAALKKAGAKRIMAAVTHAVLCGPAMERINKSDIEELAVTDTIPIPAEKKNHKKIKVLSIAPLLGEAIRRIHNGKSVSELFK